jgi:hypothetical protein
MSQRTSQKLDAMSEMAVKFLCGEKIELPVSFSGEDVDVDATLVVLWIASKRLEESTEMCLKHMVADVCIAEQRVMHNIRHTEGPRAGQWENVDPHQMRSAFARTFKLPAKADNTAYTVAEIEEHECAFHAAFSLEAAAAVFWGAENQKLRRQLYWMSYWRGVLVRAMKLV